MVSHLPWAIGNGIVAALLLSSAVLLIMPVEFRPLKNPNNAVATMRAEWLMFLMKCPTPNFNFSDDQVYNFYQLPKTARLSQRMVEVGRCGLAVTKVNQKIPTKFGIFTCFCGDIWWVPIMTILAVGVALISLRHFIDGLLAGKQPLTIADLRAKFCSENLLFVTIMFGVVVYWLNFSFDLSYVNYGDLYSTSYFNLMPAQWTGAYWLFIGGGFVQACLYSAMIHFVARSVSKANAKKPAGKKMVQGSEYLVVPTLNRDAPKAPVKKPAKNVSWLSYDNVLDPKPKSETPAVKICTSVAADDSDSSSRSSIIVPIADSPPTVVEKVEKKSDVVIVVDETKKEEKNEVKVEQVEKIEQAEKEQKGEKIEQESEDQRPMVEKKADEDKKVGEIEKKPDEVKNE